MPELDENMRDAVEINQFSFSQEEIKRREQELEQLRKRIELLTTLTSS